MSYTKIQFQYQSGVTETLIFNNKDLNRIEFREYPKIQDPDKEPDPDLAKHKPGAIHTRIVFGEFKIELRDTTPGKIIELYQVNSDYTVFCRDMSNNHVTVSIIDFYEPK